MQALPLTKSLLQGAVSSEETGEGLRPWRIPWQEQSLFAPPLVVEAGMPAGVRVGFESTAQNVEISFVPAEVERLVDCVVDGELVATAALAAGERTVRFSGLEARPKRIELFLSQKAPMTVTGLAIDDDAPWSELPDDRPRWITYGSSITQAKAAASPAQTWPAIVARKRKLHLTCLGYSAQCHLEPMVARMIRDLPADFVSLCLGINVMGGATLSPRTFRWAAIGMVKIIREKHPDIPIVVQSPIYSPSREMNENAVGFNLVKMRAELQEAVAALQALGDGRLFYVDGLSILGPEYEAYLPDGLHPDAEGYRIMARNFEQQVIEGLGIGRILGV